MNFLWWVMIILLLFDGWSVMTLEMNDKHREGWEAHFGCWASGHWWINTNLAWWNISTLHILLSSWAFSPCPIPKYRTSSSHKLITLWCRVCLQVCHFSVLKEPMVASLHGTHNVMQCTCKGRFSRLLAFCLFVLSSFQKQIVRQTKYIAFNIHFILANSVTVPCFFSINRLISIEMLLVSPYICLWNRKIVRNIVQFVSHMNLGIKWEYTNARSHFHSPPWELHLPLNPRSPSLLAKVSKYK